LASSAGRKSRFKARLQRPAKAGKGGAWTFLVLPKAASGKLPRRGRTTIEGTLNGEPFQATLEPDGQLSHWLKVDDSLRKAGGAEVGDLVTLDIAPVAKEPEPKLPPDLQKVLKATPAARATWDATTTLSRVDWIHWIESAKQANTRQRRIDNACDMLQSGKRKVCCFDSSGFYDKSLKAPEATDQEPG